MNLTRDARRDQVVAGVLKIIGDHGMAGLTTAALAKEVGMSEANLYRHFKNKQEVLSETVTRIGEGLRGNIESVAASSSSPVERLKEIFRLHLQYVSANPGIPRLVFSDEIHANSAELKARLLEMISDYTRKLEGIIVEGKQGGSIRESMDTRAAAITFIGMIQVTILRWVLSGFTLSIEHEGIMLWDNFETCLRRESAGTIHRKPGTQRRPK